MKIKSGKAEEWYNKQGSYLVKSTRAGRKMQQLRQKGTKAEKEPQSNYDSDNDAQVLNAYNKPGVMLVGTGQLLRVSLRQG